MFVAVYAGARETAAASRSTAGTNAWNSIACATSMAVGIELCLLASPYASFFGIPVTLSFVVVTITAHLIFGLGLGAYFAWLAAKWRLPAPAAAV
jgi:uncharacterized membrane protein